LTLPLKLPKVSVIAGGPPFQGFSSAGQRKQGDERNTLVYVFSNIVAKHQPKAFLKMLRGSFNV